MLVIPPPLDHSTKRDPSLIGYLTIGYRSALRPSYGLLGRLYSQSVIRCPSSISFVPKDLRLVSNTTNNLHL
jgi:hypothetical protein